MERILNKKHEIDSLVYAQNKAIVVFNNGLTWHVLMTPAEYSILFNKVYRLEREKRVRIETKVCKSEIMELYNEYQDYRKVAQILEIPKSVVYGIVFKTTNGKSLSPTQIEEIMKRSSKMSYREIALEMGLKRDTVKSVVRRERGKGE